MSAPCPAATLSMSAVRLRCFGIGDNAGWSERRDDLDQECKDQRKSKANIAHTQLTARQPGKEFGHWIGGE